MKKKHIAKELLEKYRNGTCTDEERAVVESWHLAQLAEKQSDISNEQLELVEKRVWNAITNQEAAPRLSWQFRYGIAASFIIILFTAAYFFFNSANVATPMATAKSEKVVPGGNKAVLTLIDGSEIVLDQVKNGRIALQNQTMIHKSDDGMLQYGRGDKAQNASPDQPPAYNTLTVPNGGQYQIILPDGTQVWINSMSSIRFPVTFSGATRDVKLTGEAYFEVAKDANRPFRVITTDQAVEVLGTHFNVNAYDDEPDVRTTLLEGSVRIATPTDNVTIRPGQQAIFNRRFTAVNVQKTDVDAVIAWKNGYFEFKNEKIESIMRKVARWYDVEIDYHKGYSQQTYVGSISKFEHVSKVLSMLELTGTANFKLEGRRIMVMP